MFRQNVQQLCFKMVDRMFSDVADGDDGFKIVSGELKSFITDELRNIDDLEAKYDFLGDKYLVCPRDISLLISAKFFQIFPSMEKKFKKILGNFNLDIAYQYVTVYTGASHRQSLLWHHDSVGHRLKVFIPLFTTSSENSLYWERGTHLKYKKPIYGDNRKSYEPRGIINGYGADVNEILVLNTNCMHSGNSNIPQGNVRNMFVLEFSNRFKSYVFATRVGIRNKV